jgi:hypothetical protein
MIEKELKKFFIPAASSAGNKLRRETKFIGVVQ